LAHVNFCSKLNMQFEAEDTNLIICVNLHVEISILARDDLTFTKYAFWQTPI